MPRRRLSIRRASLVPEELLDAAPSQQTVADKGENKISISNENENSFNADASADSEAGKFKSKASIAAKQLTPTDAATGFGFFNDDEEEKRNSRKKAARRRSMRRRSLRPSPRKAKSKDAAGSTSAAIKEKKDPAQLKTLYSAIIKMCAQNKITEKNCWNDFIDNIDEILAM